MPIHPLSQDVARVHHMVANLRGHALRAQHRASAMHRDMPTFPAGTISRAQYAKSAELWADISDYLSEAVDKIEHALEAN